MLRDSRFYYQCQHFERNQRYSHKHGHEVFKHACTTRNRTDARKTLLAEQWTIRSCNVPIHHTDYRYNGRHFSILTIRIMTMCVFELFIICVEICYCFLFLFVFLSLKVDYFIYCSNASCFVCIYGSNGE